MNAKSLKTAKLSDEELEKIIGGNYGFSAHLGLDFNHLWKKYHLPWGL